MENRFRALSLLRASAESADSRHDRRRLASRAKPSTNGEQHLEDGGPKDASAEVEDELVEEAVEEVWLDAFLLSLIFSHIHDGPFLARLRLVCGHWCVVIDEDKRLWKDLLWRDFRWRKDRHRGKGRKKKNQLREKCVYQKRYAELSHQRRQAELKEAKRRLVHQDRVIKTAHILPGLVRLLCVHRRDCDENHPWFLCPHPEPWLDVAGNGTERRWCACRACGVELLVSKEHHKYWLAHYPQLLSVSTPDDFARTRHLKTVASKLKLARETPSGTLSATAAHTTYAAYLQSLAEPRPSAI